MCVNPVSPIFKIIALSIGLALSSAAAAERFDQRAWRRVRVYDMPELQKLDTLPLGKIIGVRFNYRHSDIRQPHAHWYLGSIWRVVRSDEKAEFMHVNVMVPEAELAAFKTITTDFRAQQKHVVYGEALHYRESTFPFLRLIGKKVKRDKRGAVTVTW
jgi:hypothetical protein